jgi:toxin ParE1/3/4
VKLRLTRPAARQLDEVLAHIAQHNPQGSRSIQDRIQALMDLLLQHPFAGQATPRRGIRRVLAVPYPYAITYTVSDSEIVILGVRHTSRRPLTG